MDRLRYRADEHTRTAETAAGRRVDLDTETDLRAAMPTDQTQAETVLRTGWQRDQAAAAAARRQQRLEHERHSYDYHRHHDIDRGIDRAGPSIGM